MADLCNEKKPVVIALGGPTATGKTALSVSLAKQFDGEIISADSMQVYKGLTIGTAKVLPEEQGGIPHHLVDFLEPTQPFSVVDFVQAAQPIISQITERNHLPILVGGTGLYQSSLLKGIVFSPEKSDPAVRNALQERALQQGSAAMYEELQRIDPDYARKVHPNHLPRIIRALELYELTGRKMSEQQRDSHPAEPPYRSLCLCLTFRDRQLLYQRINTRIDRMVEQGILEEAQYVYENRARFTTATQAIGYKEFFPYFEHRTDLSDCIEKLKQASRNYAKRQLTWFRHQTDAVWLEADVEDVCQKAHDAIVQFLQTP